MQKVTTTGNATLIAYDDRPVLVTDPWFGDEQPAYFGSWVLSHHIPSGIKQDMKACDYVWFSHGHPDHLNPADIERFRGKKILLPDHFNGRIFNDLAPNYDVTILRDRTWIELSKNIKVQCITTSIQDAILLVDVAGRLFIDLNDAGGRESARYIRGIARGYAHSYALALSGYGDADMINFFDEQGKFILPRAARKPSVGRQLNLVAKATGARTVVPFSSFHQYQRADSMWAQQYTTPMSAFSDGLEASVGYIPPFSSIDCRDGTVETYAPQELVVTPRPPEEFGDNWSDELTQEDKQAIDAYFARKEPVQAYLGFVNFRVGGKDYASRMRGPKDRGITFEVPRGSLMTSINYRIFDDLLIGNFMKTTLHGVRALNDGHFNYYVAKYGDNGGAETHEELKRYLAEYRRRSGIDYILSAFEDKSKDFITRFAAQDTQLYKMIKKVYVAVR